MPNFPDLLKIYNLAMSKPDEVLNLNHISCGTIRCAMGHAAQDPYFQEKGLILVGRDIYWKGQETNYDEAAAMLFGITPNEAGALFGISYIGIVEPVPNQETIGQEHKKILTGRFKKFFEEHGEKL